MPCALFAMAFCCVADATILCPAPHLAKKRIGTIVIIAIIVIIVIIVIMVMIIITIVALSPSWLVRFQSVWLYNCPTEVWC